MTQKTNYTYQGWKKKRLAILKGNHTSSFNYKMKAKLNSAHYCSMCGKEFTKYVAPQNYVVKKSFKYLRYSRDFHLNLCLRVDDCWKNYEKGVK